MIENNTLNFMKQQEHFYNAVDGSMKTICHEIISSLMKTIYHKAIRRQDILICGYCWHKINHDNYYCGYCGHRIGSNHE